MNDKEKGQLVEEVNVLRKLHHQNIVRYYERHIDKKASLLSIFMEYCDNGTLQQLINSKKSQLNEGRQKTGFSEDFIWSVLTQLACGLDVCHTFREGSHKNNGGNSSANRPIIHRDLKPENIFMTKGGILKIGDFGLSKTLDTSDAFAKTLLGTPTYMSPVIGGKYTATYSIHLMRVMYATFTDFCKWKESE